MTDTNRNSERSDAINKLAADAKLAEVAEWLDLHVVGRGTRSPKTLCPFHADQRPSMYLYPAGAGGREHFHCFSCGAHGDVFDLIKRQLNVDFRGALEWLADHYRRTLPVYSSSTREARVSSRTRGLQLGFEVYSHQNVGESSVSLAWASKRRLDSKVLKAAEAFAVFPAKLSKSGVWAERENLDALYAAGLLIPETIARVGESVALPLGNAPRDFYSSMRIIFTIRDDRGEIVGFAGRAIENDLPKYLFSPGFPRGSTLYRLHKVRAARPPRGSKGAEAVVHLFVVEGLMDTLRLEALGLHSVAVLGSQITTDQLALLTDYARDLDRSNVQLAVHLFLDNDEAGHRGTVAAVVKLLEASIAAPGMVFDVLVPQATTAIEHTNAHDPDELLREVTNSREALALLSTWCVAPMGVLLATALEVAPVDLASRWKVLPDGQRLQAFRDVERRLDRDRWIEILDRVPTFECHLGTPVAELLDWQEPMRRFLRATRGRATAVTAPVTQATKDNTSRLIRAIQVAEASTQRREFPIDEGSWDRLQAAMDVTIPHLSGLLEMANDRSVLDADLMLSVLVPKGDGKFRLKALPSPEILSLQQYVLNELLRDYVECPRFQRFIPGVRFATSSGSRRLETTGADRFVPVNGETVSFAYTLDMDVIGHLAPPRRTGMFRSYFECWRDFISFIDARVAAFPSGQFHVARLDVRSFYDTVSRPAVNAVLLPAVTDALAALADNSETNAALACAQLFLPKLAEPNDRARALVDWLCDQSFDYQFENPGSVDPPDRSDGLPQGPDLSAYLANISLFPLDRALSELVAKLDRQAIEEQGEMFREGKISAVRGAVYARYVDDMVIIARTGHDLARLRATIEQQLALVGMELSPKTEPLPVMNEAEVREWLTDRRGAALGVSGPFEGPPGNAPLSLLEPLADAGETDRSDSLRILHDPRLDDPDTTPDELESAVEVILAAPDLRHGDKASASRHLWRSVIQSGESEASATDLAKRFIECWSATKSPANESKESSQEDFVVSDLLSWLDGVERLLTSRPDRNPTFSEEKHRKLRDLRIRMAEIVHEGLCDVLIGSVISIGAPSRFERMLELKTLVIRRAATLVKKPVSPTEITIEAGDSRAKARLLISLAEAQGSPALLDRAGLRANATKLGLGILFHEAVARLRIANHEEQNRADPLTALSQSLDLWRQGGGTTRPLESVLHLWMPDSPITSDLLAAERALNTLVNLASRRAIELIDRRPALKAFALDGSEGSRIRLLPTPPGLNVPGMLGMRDGDQFVLRADFRREEEPLFCPPLSWADKGGGGDGQWKRFESSLGAHQYLPPPIGNVSHPSITGWVAKAFRSLVTATRVSGLEFFCPPTASNLLGPEIGAETAESKWEILGFCVPAANVSGQAFLRQGDGGLVLEAILELNDHLWRVGTALADWLGRAPSTRQLSTQRLAAPALVENDGDDWAREAMLRFSLCRLRGKSLPARPLRISPSTGLPMTIERVLKRLETFPSDPTNATGEVGVAHLLATLAEGRAIQTRIDTRIDSTTPGGASALLAEMARGQFRADEELAHRLPASEGPLAEWAPKRRSVRALFALSERLRVLGDLDPMRIDSTVGIPTLDALASGTGLLCLELQLRTQALELWSLVDLTAQLKFQESPPNLAEWSLDTTALLHREQPMPLEGSPVPDDWRNVRELFQQLYQATSEGQRVHWGAIAGITPLGWLVVIGALTGALAGDWRGSLVNGEQLGLNERSQLKTLVAQLALTGADGDDLPWGGLEGIILAWDSARLQEALITLSRLDVASGLRVETHESSRFFLEASRRRPTEVQTSDGRRQLPGWAISWAKASGESGGGIERIVTPPSEERVIYRWSETWRGDRLVGIGVVQPAMVALAGMAFTGVEHSISEAIPEDSPNETAFVPPSDEAVPRAIAALPPKQGTPTPMLSPQPPAPKAAAVAENDVASAIVKLEQMQETSWRKRGEKPQSHVRVALFQWDVDETYRHPIFDLCDHSSPKLARAKPETWIAHAEVRSCAEFRRRALLKAALKACNHFNVDVLLLPEYSTRPDTVEWLAIQAPMLAPGTSVWAGTYRLPPGMLHPQKFPAWSAVHEVVLAQHADRRPARGKKYPAAAADEVFYPGGLAMDPLFADQKIGDVRSYLYELICSEIFLVTSPANLRPLARVRRDLLRKFNAGVQGKDLEAVIKQDVIEDIGRFAHHTALSEGLGIRRTILLVPSMTSRSADFSVLGQAGFLASGLTTVFCNAICPPYGHGQSCFIGHGSWIDGKEVPGLATFEPYHGARPGIFQLDHLHQGRLGKNEQALVIADIDPIYGTEGRPRPQALLKPLQLIAHLPVIETWQPKPGTLPNACRCGRMQWALDDVGEFASFLHSALIRGIDGRWQTTMEDPDPKVLGDAMKLLADCGGKPHSNSESGRGWLMRRSEAYVAHHLADPTPWPPPVALDWLWVDPGAINEESYPSIESPAYAAPPGGGSREGQEDV